MTLTWSDDGGVHVVRRNGRWLATPGAGTDTFVDSTAPAGASYVIRTWVDGSRTDRSCVEGEPPPPPTADVERVIHIGIDGLRSDHVTPAAMPALTALIGQSSSTLNARTDADRTQTLPMHASQYTSRPVLGPWGHQVSFNTDNGSTIHQAAGAYVTSVFDVVHDNGGRTAVYAGKSKFDFYDRSWNAANGAPDTTGIDNGRDKIDVYRQGAPSSLLTPFLAELQTATDLEYVFFHIRTPDEVGHRSGWASTAYVQGTTDADGILASVVDFVQADADLATTTAILVTSDHGGPTNGFLHADWTLEKNYTVPFVVWVPGRTGGADLYDLNADDRTDPGTGQPPPGDPNRPIRTSETANLVLDLLGYPAIAGSTENAAQDLDFD